MPRDRKTHIRADGSLRLLRAQAAQVGVGAVDIARDREGRYPYALNTIEGTVEGYRVGADGRLTSIARAGGVPHACLLDPAKPECTKRRPERRRREVPEGESSMPILDATERFAALNAKLSPQEYNYEHFRTKHYLLDLQGTAKARGVQPGEEAPDWELPKADGGTLRLSGLRGTPVLLHLGSFT